MDLVHRIDTEVTEVGGDRERVRKNGLSETYIGQYEGRGIKGGKNLINLRVHEMK